MSNLIKQIIKGKIRIFLRCFVIMIMVFQILTQKIKIQNNRNLEVASSEISVKISGSGYQKIISSNFRGVKPDIYLNDEQLCESCGEVYDLKEEENILILRFPDTLFNFREIFKDSQNLIEANFTNFHFEGSLFKMFYGCKNVKYINMSKYHNSIKVSGFDQIFKYCQSLISLDISSFDTSLITEMFETFSNCNKLISIDLSNFNTELVESMQSMFFNCKSLESLNLSNFNTISVDTMNKMFYSCQSLTSIDISNFNTEKVIDMISMFSNCHKLKVLDLSNFKTPILSTFYYIFNNCYSLTSLNISNFITSNIKSMSNLFMNCSSLTSLDLSNFDTSSTQFMDQMFYGCKSLISLDLSNFNMEKVTNIDKMFYNCEKLEYINFGNAKESDSISTSYTFHKTPKNIVYCINLANKIESALLEENGECAKNDCSDNWKEKQLKIIDGTNTCIDNCQNNLDYRYQYENKCYSSCPNGTQPSNSNENICIINDHTENSENDNICHAKPFFQKKCKINSDNIEERVKMVKTINNEIMNGSLDELLYVAKENKISIYIAELNEIYEINYLSIKIENTKNNNISSLINFGECQKRLKNHYHFNENEELILFKMEYFIKGFYIPIIEFEIFSPNGTIKLNLDICKDLYIQLYIPVNIDENNLYKHDPSSDFYNDRCYPYTTESGTDIILYDRKNEFNYQNLSLCEYNCIYKGYDFDNKAAECKCKIKTFFRFFSDIIDIEPGKLLNNFINFKDVSNIHVIKCYKLLFSKNGLIYNIGFYTLLIIILITIVESIIFCNKGYKLLYTRIKEIFNMKFNTINLNMNLNNDKTQNIIINKQPTKKENEISNFPYIKIKKKIIKKNIRINTINTNFNSSNTYEIKTNKEKKDISIINERNDSIYNGSINILKLNDYELNSLSYKDALKYDKRSYSEYFLSLLKTKQLVIFTFFQTNDYNSQHIKKCLFFFSFALYYIVNALFFNDSTMHKIYEDKGTFNLVFQLPQLFYSTIISTSITKILAFLSMTEKNIVDIKKEKEKSLELSTQNMEKLTECLIIKFRFFYIIDFLFLIIFWYYISCFCAVYKNTQVYLLEDSIISYFTSLLYPFAFNIIPTILRINALKAENTDKDCLYKISSFLTIIF